MLQEPVKLLNMEQFELLYYRLLPVESVTVYTQVTLVLNGFPAKKQFIKLCVTSRFPHILLDVAFKLTVLYGLRKLMNNFVSFFLFSFVTTK